MKPVHLVEAPSNLGLKEPEPGKQPGVHKLPNWLKQWGFYEVVSPHQIHTVPPPPYSMELDRESGVRNANAIVRYSQQLCQVVAPLVSSGVFPMVLGGDCSILLGNMLALKSLGAYGLFFLDGHTDYAWPPMSASGGAAGMDLALVTGNGHEKLTNLNGLGPYVWEKHVWSVGNRDFDKAYVDAMCCSSIHYVNLPTVRRMGPAECVRLFLNMVEREGLQGFWIHLDVDVLDDELMPAVDSREKGGFTYPELNQMLEALLASDKAVGMEITILDPDLDLDGTATQAFVQGLKPTLEAHFSSRAVSH